MAGKKPTSRRAASSPKTSAKAKPTPGRPPSAPVLPPGNPPAHPIEPPGGLWERIAGKAYALWEQRGRRAGHDMEDWLDAETQVLEEMHEARE